MDFCAAAVVAMVAAILTECIIINQVRQALGIRSGQNQMVHLRTLTHTQTLSQIYTYKCICGDIHFAPFHIHLTFSRQLHGNII